MEEACSALELEFKRVGNDLEFVAHRMENDSRQSSSSTVSSVPNVLAMARRLSAVMEKMNSLSKKMSMVEEKRQELDNTVCQEVAANFIRLEHLVTVSNCDLSSGSAQEHEQHWRSAADEVMQGMDANTNGHFAKSEEHIESTSSALVSGGVRKTRSSGPGTVAPRTRLVTGNGKSVFHSMQTTENDPENDGNSAVNFDMVDKPSTIFGAGSRMEQAAAYITAAQFKSVPVSVRGRCKLSDMHLIVERLIANKGCMSVKELDAAGIKLAGKTGVQMLATLSHLNVIKRNRQEITLQSRNNAPAPMATRGGRNQRRPLSGLASSAVR